MKKRMAIGIAFAAIAASLVACNSPKGQPKELDKAKFDTVLNGQAVKLYSLKNKNGMLVELTNYGARVVTLWAPDKKGEFADVALGYGSIKEYLTHTEHFYGATIGRYGNRIGKSTFVLNGDSVKLAPNEKVNCLHGGPGGFFSKVFKADAVSDSTITFSVVSADGDQGFPGELTVKVKYTLTAKNELKVEYEATTSKPTVVNLTNHTYFNLKGEANGSINDHFLTINADKFTVIDSLLIPTGELRAVEGTPMDFRSPKEIGAGLKQDYEQLTFGKGFDHNWVLNGTDGTVKLAARVVEQASGRVMEVLTNEPGLQFYGGNFIDGKELGKYGKTLNYREAFCLETQHFPDSPNKPQFPTTVLNPGDTYHSTCIYRFSVQ